MEEDPNEQLGKLIYSGYFLTKQKGRSMTQYYSNSKEEFVNINDMHHQHVWYAFKKLCDRLEDLGLSSVIWEDNFDPRDLGTNKFGDFYLRKSTNLNANSKSVFKLEKKVSELLSEVEKLTSWNNYYQRQKKWDDKALKNLKNTPNHKWKQSCAYVFSEIPNDYEGRDLVKQLKRYLNKDRYKVRVRGQYLDDKTKKEEGWRNYTHGQPLNKSKCLRVYIDEKKESV